METLFINYSRIGINMIALFENYRLQVAIFFNQPRLRRTVAYIYVGLNVCASTIGRPSLGQIRECNDLYIRQPLTMTEQAC